ncbi:UDP-glucose 4-epimerase [Chitinispirillum alkaliphilum]|nr:UDP-glucose 4-epimerase [Chitinispirillum alkaliphilum]
MIKTECQNLNGPIVVTGGAGFIGTNLCSRLLEMGHEVVVYDNLSRAGSETNLEYLQHTYKKRLKVSVADMRDTKALCSSLEGAAAVFHLAAQVAVTTSLNFPSEDYSVNLQGTINLLEILRSFKTPPFLLYTSTNKVYGQLGDIKLRKIGKRYEPSHSAYSDGISEKRNLDFHTPYGCSKGSADQYVLDYSRTFGIPAVVFRMSCIYGPHQFGTEDQGWVAHFAISALEKKPITLYGDGCQVRDILYIDDLLDAFLLALNKKTSLRGCAFNIGGGSSNTVSLLELIYMLNQVTGYDTQVCFEPFRCGDQKYYVSDTSKFTSATGWVPLISSHEGLRILCRWLEENRFEKNITFAEKERF